ncbi:unnamed protein product [Rotaria socialis]|uniref:Uncharacterized protein n=1 Tax=Rotaria socialis TaxID=392032 RepID=A0A820TPJ5_9BILA|nr:unnamed protein product [Rotaria socialis]
MEHTAAFVYCAQRLLVEFTKKNFPLASWTFTATGHGKRADDGIDAIMKTIATCATLSKNILLSTAKDFHEFSKAQQLETVRKSNNDSPDVHIFDREVQEAKKVTNNFLKATSEKLRKSGTIRGVQVMHEFKPISHTTVQYRQTSRSTHIRTFTFR